MTATSAMPILVRLLRKQAMLSRVLGCAHKPHLHPVDPDACAETPDLDWSHCPLDLAAGPHMQAVRHLVRLAEVSPLADWPLRYAAWAVAGVLLVKRS